MNNIPQIIVNSGFEVDQNGALTEIILPSVVTTLNAPSKVAFNGTTLNWIPSTSAALTEFDAPNCTTISASAFKSFAALKKVSIGSLTTLYTYGTTVGQFYNCTALTTLHLPALETITTGGTGSGAFYNCTALTTVAFPSLKASNNIGTPSNSGVFPNCTNLTSVQLGSEGHAVTAIANYMFLNCTQSGLTITVYTADGNAISGSPWGATNATIVWEEA